MLELIYKKFQVTSYNSFHENPYGNMVISIKQPPEIYVVRPDYTIWHNFGDWLHPDWREIK